MSPLTPELFLFCKKHFLFASLSPYCKDIERGKWMKIYVVYLLELKFQKYRQVTN